MYSRDRTWEASTSGGYSVPQFYSKKAGVSSLGGKIQREARLRLLGVQNSMILDNSKLEQIWYILRQFVGLSNEAGGQDRLNYDEFCQAAATCVEVFGMDMEPFLKPSVFLRLQRDSSASVSLLSLFNYIMRRNAMLQTRVHLSCFDELGEGFLTEDQLQSYIMQLVPELPGLQHLERHMDLQTYGSIAIRKFHLFHTRNNRMKIRELLPSPALAELLELRLPASEDDNAAGQPGNWFGLPSIMRLISQFQLLDADGNGHLSKAEFSGLSSGTMTPLFIERIFEEHAAAKLRDGVEGESAASVAGEMDFTAFVDFALAWDHRASEAGVHYFFAVLDIHGRGYITQVELYAFLKEIYKMWVGCGQYKELSVEDVKDEIFDIVQPADPLRITAKDLVGCRMAGTVISMLADVNLFWEYDMRETLLQRDESHEAGALDAAAGAQ